MKKRMPKNGFPHTAMGVEANGDPSSSEIEPPEDDDLKPVEESKNDSVRTIPIRLKSTQDVQDVQSNTNDKSKFDFCMWSVSGTRYFPCEDTVEQLPPAVYHVDESPQRGLFFRKMQVNLDDLIHLPDSESESVLSEIRKFWAREKHFREFGFLWKRGILLWGPPGGGKTCTVQHICMEIVKRGGIALYSAKAPGLTVLGLSILRQIEPTRPIVVIVEDIDAMTEQYGESEILSLLDGESNVDNVVFIATTNYPERLDKRIINRPSRFDLVKKIGLPSAAARREFILAKNLRFKNAEHVNSQELDSWVEETKSFSIAHIKELIISVEVFGTSLEEAAKRLRDMQNIKISSDQDRSMEEFGFMKGNVKTKNGLGGSNGSKPLRSKPLPR